MSETCDLIVVGAGIVGLAHAYTAARRGLRVTVVERDHRCVGASIPQLRLHHGHGPARGRHLAPRPRQPRRVGRGGTAGRHRGRTPRPVAAGPPAEGRGGAAGLHGHRDGRRQRTLRRGRSRGAGAGAADRRRERGHVPPHELRVESRAAIPRLAAWLAERQGVRFLFGEAVLEVQAPRVRTARRELQAERVVICPGTELNGVGAAALAPHALKLCRLQMLRVRPEPGFTLPAAVMGDLSLVRYGGYAALPEAAPLLAQLQDEEAASLAAGIHLIVVQSADGTLVVGDSHHTFSTPEPSPTTRSTA